MSLKPNPVGWFEIPAVDIERAKAFYEASFGIKLERHDLPAADGSVCKMAWFPMHEEVIGAAGSLVEHPEYKPAAEGVVIYFSVEDINAALAEIEAAGGKTVVPETSIGEHGFFARFLDTEGNCPALHRRAEGT